VGSRENQDSRSKNMKRKKKPKKEENKSDKGSRRIGYIEQERRSSKT